MKWLLILIVGALLAGECRADAAGVLPGVKNARAVYQIETAEEFPEYVFILVRESWNVPQHKAEFLELSPETPVVFRLSGPLGEEAGPINREEATIYYALRNKHKPGATAQELLKAETQWLTRLDYRVSVPSWQKESEVAVSYRIQRAKGSDRLELVRVGRDPMQHWKIAAIAVSVFCPLAVLLGGIWVVRAVLRSPPPPKYTPREGL